MMKKPKYAQVERHFQEIKILRGENLSWKEITEYMSTKHHLRIEESYIRKTWGELADKEPPPSKKVEAEEKIRIHMDMQPLSIAEKEKLEKYKHLADKRERLLVAAQQRAKELEETLKSFVVELEEGRRQMGKMLYGRLHGIATGKIVRGKRTWP